MLNGEAVVLDSNQPIEQRISARLAGLKHITTKEILKMKKETHEELKGIHKKLGDLIKKKKKLVKK